MIVGIGTDIIEIKRIEKALSKNQRFLEKLFTESEREYFKSKEFKVETIAGNFAAKEAISKAFGTGFSKLSMSDIEVLRTEEGKPYVKLNNSRENPLYNLEKYRIHVSISHCKEYATSVAILEAR